MLPSPYGDPFHPSPFRSPSIPSGPLSEEQYTRGALFGDPMSPPAHDALLSDDGDASFSSTTMVEGCSSDGSRTLNTTSDGAPHQSIFVAGNSHTKSVLALGMTKVKKFSFKNKSPSGTLEQGSASKLKLLNRSLPRLVSMPMRPSLHSSGANEDATPSLSPLGTPSSSVDPTRAEVFTLPSIWLISPTPRQPGFSSPIILDDEPSTPSTSSSPFPVVIYEPTISEVARAHHYLRKKPLPAIPIVIQRQSVVAAFVRRLGSAMGFRREHVQSPHPHSHVYDKSDVDKRAGLHSRPSPRIRTYSYDAATSGLTTTKQTPSHQPDQGMVGCRTIETITDVTDGEARQLSSFGTGRPNRAPRTGTRNGIDLEGMVTDFVRAEDAKRSGTVSAVGNGRQGSGSQHSPSQA